VNRTGAQNLSQAPGSDRHFLFWPWPGHVPVPLRSI